MRRNWAPKTEDIRDEENYEKKMHEAFMAHLGKRYEEQLFEEDARNMDIHAPQSLDDWFLEFCKEKWGAEAVVMKKDEKDRMENMEIAEQEDTKEMAVGQNREEDEEYFALLMYAEQMRVKLKKQQEKQQRMKKVAAFVAFLLVAAALVTSTAKTFGFNPWKLFVKDEGTNGIISPKRAEEERNYYLSSDWIGYYYPEYIPEGYELVGDRIDEYYGKLNFVNGKDEICFFCVFYSSVTALDKEREEYELIQIENQTGYLVVKEEQLMAFLYLDECTISVLYNSVGTEEIYQIMKNIKKFL